MIFANACNLKGNTDHFNHNEGALLTKLFFDTNLPCFQNDDFAKNTNYYYVRELCNFNIQRSPFCVILKEKQLEKVLGTSTTVMMIMCRLVRALCILGSPHNERGFNFDV